MGSVATWLGAQPLTVSGAMKRHALLLTALALSGLWPGGGGSSEKALAMRDLEAAVHRDLAPGTSRSRVIAFLQQHNVPYHDSTDIAYFKGPRTIWGLLTRTASKRL